MESSSVGLADSCLMLDAKRPTTLPKRTSILLAQARQTRGRPAVQKSIRGFQLAARIAAALAFSQWQCPEIFLWFDAQQPAVICDRRIGLLQFSSYRGLRFSASQQLRDLFAQFRFAFSTSRHGNPLPPKACNAQPGNSSPDEPRCYLGQHSEGASIPFLRAFQPNDCRSVV
jgi:hypothetical protein